MNKSQQRSCASYSRRPKST